MAGLDLLGLGTLPLQQRIILVFEGRLSQGVLRNLVAALRERLLDVERAGTPAVRRVCAAFVELAQNVQRHSADRVAIDERDTGAGLVVVREEPGAYLVTSGNRVRLPDAAALVRRCDDLARLDAEGLKQAYRSRLRAKRREDVEGAGLGLIEVMRKSGHPIAHELTPLDDAFGFVSLTVTLRRDG